ncbi:MAG: NAD(P)-binding domain-containing protein, partial [Woeseiaceae bacterium]
MRTAFIGLGVMGYPMAGFLAKAGHEVVVYNRTASRAEVWANEFGGRSVATPAAAAEKAEFVFCCVGNDDDVREVVLGEHGVLAGAESGAIIV